MSSSSSSSSSSFSSATPAAAATAFEVGDEEAAMGKPPLPVGRTGLHPALHIWCVDSSTAMAVMLGPGARRHWLTATAAIGSSFRI